MKKSEIIEQIADEVRGKGTSPTDIRCMFCDAVESAARDNYISEHQRMTWILSPSAERKLIACSNKTCCR